MATPKKRKRRKKVAKSSLGLSPSEVTAQTPPASVATLAEQIEKDDGKVLAIYREPMGKHWQILCALPVNRIEPTRFQRDLSDAHVKRLMDKIEKLERYLDPITVVYSDEGKYLTPNGHHRTSAMNRLGQRTIMALVVADFSVAYQILALNTEKAYNLREKSLEAIRLARELSETIPAATEEDFANQFEEPRFLLLGCCYEKMGKFSGGAYASILKKTESFSDAKMGRSLKQRAEDSDRLLKLDKMVAKTVERLKERGLKSPYLKYFVIARINPVRWSPEPTADFDKTLTKMENSIQKFDVEKIQPHHIASMGGAPPEGE